MKHILTSLELVPSILLIHVGSEPAEVADKVPPLWPLIAWPAINKGQAFVCRSHTDRVVIVIPALSISSCA